jgi:hypothetical protein
MTDMANLDEKYFIDAFKYHFPFCRESAEATSRPKRAGA